MLNSLDILYTPLISPEAPSVDTKKLLDWIYKNRRDQEVDRRGDASKKLSPNFYPWDIIYPKSSGKWNFDFDTEFPSLAEHFSKAYALDHRDVWSVLLLPTKVDFKGMGFWHSDPDLAGLRMYIENQETEDFLHIKPTVEPYRTRPDFTLDQNFPTTPIQHDVIHNAKLYKPNQAFYLNNVRAVHAIKTHNPGTLRIAVIVGVLEHVKLLVEKHIVKSAEHFKDYALLWTPPK